jgi:hypothetical protein
MSRQAVIWGKCVSAIYGWARWHWWIVFSLLNRHMRSSKSVGSFNRTNSCSGGFGLKLPKSTYRKEREAKVIFLT